MQNLKWNCSGTASHNDVDMILLHPHLHLLITLIQLGFSRFFLSLLSLSYLVCQSSFYMSAKKSVAWWPNGVQTSNSPFSLWSTFRLWSLWRGKLPMQYFEWDSRFPAADLLHPASAVMFLSSAVAKWLPGWKSLGLGKGLRTRSFLPVEIKRSPYVERSKQSPAFFCH